MHLISRGPLLNGILCLCACTNPITLFLSKNIRAMHWYHDGAERVLGSKSFESELFWTIVNVLVVPPVIQRFNNCMCYNFNTSGPYEQITKLISALHQMNVAALYKKHQ